MGDRKITDGNAEILRVVTEMNGRLARLEAVLAPLLPHIPAALKFLDNPASRWRERRAVRQSKGREVQEPIGPDLHREAG